MLAVKKSATHALLLGFEMLSQESLASIMIVEIGVNMYTPLALLD
jgi:hypothetical protein